MSKTFFFGVDAKHLSIILTAMAYFGIGIVLKYLARKLLIFFNCNFLFVTGLYFNRHDRLDVLRHTVTLSISMVYHRKLEEIFFSILSWIFLETFFVDTYDLVGYLPL